MHVFQCLPSCLSIRLLVCRAWWTVVWAVRLIATTAHFRNRHQCCMHVWVCLLKLGVCMHEQHTSARHVRCHFIRCCHQKPFIPHWMRDSLPAGSSVSRNMGHVTHHPPKPCPSPQPNPAAWCIMLCTKSNQRINQLVAFYIKLLIWILSILLLCKKLLVFYFSFKWINWLHGALALH